MVWSVHTAQLGQSNSEVEFIVTVEVVIVVAFVFFCDFTNIVFENLLHTLD